jgi:hypothetical protein
MKAADKSPLANVLRRDRRCVGWIFRRQPREVQAYDRNEHSIEIFENNDQAVAAVQIHKKAKPRP